MTSPADPGEDASRPREVTASGAGAAAVGANSGIVSTGSGATIYQNSPVTQRLPAPTPLSRLPAPDGLTHLPPPSAQFVGRADDLERLHHALARPGPVVVAVHGLGGIGKSTLAARYATDQAASFHPIWWLTADTPANLQAGLAELATALREDPAERAELEELAQQALSWLSSHTGWLLVCDDATDPAHLQPLLSRLRSGRILVTSRLREGWRRLGTHVLHLDVLSEDEALDLLVRLARPGDPDPDGWPGARELVTELGRLPLAVEQAGAYLHQTRLAPADHLALLRERPQAVLGQAAEGTRAEHTVARIWRITLDHLAARAPLTGDLLRILAWTAPEKIPRAVLDPLLRPRPDARLRFWRRRRPGWHTRPLTDQHGLHHALGLLAAYNMVTLTDRTITVHRLVQAVARTPDPDDPHRRPEDIATACETATRLLDAALPDDITDPAAWPAVRVLLPHIDALVAHSRPETDTHTTCRLLNSVGIFLNGQGAPGQAIAYLQRSLAACRRLHGTDHPDTLVSRNNLAYAYVSAGDLEEAIPLHEETLAAFERVLGADHPHTLVSRNNLAGAYRSAGAVEKALSLHEETLADCERVLGADHPGTLLSRNNLANAYASAGDLEKAIPLHEETLAAFERVLGADHPHTLVSRNDLAETYRSAGDLEKAISLYERALADFERVLGADHPTARAVSGSLEAARRSRVEPGEAAERGREPGEERGR